MRFKEFLLKDQEDNSLELKITDILSALQNMDEDSGVLTTKVINDNLVSMVINKINPLMNSGKNPQYLEILQRVAVNIRLNAEKGDDPRPAPKGNGLMLSCKAELESLLSSSGVPIDKMNKKETKGLPEPQDSIKNDLRNSSKFLKQADQSNPGMETGIDNDKSPPLSGDGQRTLNVL